MNQWWWWWHMVGPWVSVGLLVYLALRRLFGDGLEGQIARLRRRVVELESKIDLLIIKSRGIR